MNARTWIITYNNPKQKSNEELIEFLKSIKHIRYCTGQLEQAPTTGTNHWQLYIEYTQPKTLQTVSKTFNNAHVEIRKGTREQAIQYVQKEETRIYDNYIEYGTPPKQGNRTDLIEIIELVKDGAKDSEILALYPTQFLMYQKNIKLVRETLLEEKYRNEFRDLQVIYIHGTAGVGKTRYVMEKHGYDNVFRVTNYDKHPFDGYQHQQVIVFEEFRSSMKIENMLNYLDGYPLQLPARYNDRTACYKTVYIISNWKYEEQYKLVKEIYPKTWEAWDRRIHHKLDFDDSNIIKLLSLEPANVEDLMN